jgi:hypothetical protein
VALGARSVGSVSEPLVYVSSDGKHWAEDRDRQAFPDDVSFQGSGQRGDTFIVFGAHGEQWVASP